MFNTIIKRIEKRVRRICGFSKRISKMSFLTVCCGFCRLQVGSRKTLFLYLLLKLQRLSEKETTAIHIKDQQKEMKFKRNSIFCVYAI